MHFSTKYNLVKRRMNTNINTFRLILTAQNGKRLGDLKQ